MLELGGQLGVIIQAQKPAGFVSFLPATQLAQIRIINPIHDRPIDIYDYIKLRGFIVRAGIEIDLLENIPFHKPEMMDELKAA